MPSSAIRSLRALSNPVRAKLSQRYFRTGPGEYGEGDIFIGLTVPQVRAIAKEHQDIELGEVAKLLSSGIHEYRLAALEVLVFKYEKGSEADRRKVVAFFLRNHRHINNWDLVDTSAPYILGPWLVDRDRAVLYRLAASKRIWDRRIAVVSTFAFIRNDDFGDSLRLARMLMSDRHDLMHKAVGWMLREVGKRREATLRGFLDENHATMPRTMLRYAIERLPRNEQKKYLSAK